MSWFTDMASAAPAGAISAPPGSRIIGAATGLTGGAGSLASLGGGQAGPNGPGGAMSWMQDPSAQPALGHALMGGTQILNGPQPVPGMPPRQFDPSQGVGLSTQPMTPPPPMTVAPDWQQRMLPDGTQPGLTRGSGQPINQPMTPGSGPGGTWTPQDAQRFQANPGPSSAGQGVIPMGSLQSLGGGQLNQSGMVNLRGPDGSSKAVPQSDLAHWLSKGAVRV